MSAAEIREAMQVCAWMVVLAVLLGGWVAFVMLREKGRLGLAMLALAGAVIVVGAFSS